jgi:hypothetical protein
MFNKNNDDRCLFLVIIGLGVFSFVISLTYHNIADGDLWARLAQGASIWKTGSLIYKDIFAFTPVLPEWVDHEWGSGLIFFSLLRLFGPESLLILKIITALAALGFAVAVGRFNGFEWPVLLLFAPLCALAIFPGYVLVVRSQIFTYLFFSIVLFCLEAIRKGYKWPSLAIITTMVLWTNVHGGFVAGLGIIGVYAIVAFISKRMSKIMFATFIASICVTFINPYGVKLWRYLVPALMHPRTFITEWQPMPMSLGLDSFIGFRILFIITIFALIVGWNKAEWRKYLPGLVIIIITAYLALRHRRHAPFFGLSAAAFLGPYLSASIKRVVFRMPGIIKRIKPLTAIFIIYGIISLVIANYVLPKTSFRVLTPKGFYPVRECDVLMLSKAKGNLVVPFSWGSYVSWRLYPRLKISQDGRYETIYPESTLNANHDFFYKVGDDWDRLIKENKIDYIILELYNTRLEFDDLKQSNHELVYIDEYSALFARKELARSLIDIAQDIHTKKTIQPLDADIPNEWWRKYKGLRPPEVPRDVEG